MTRLLVLSLVLALAACGSRTDLKPKLGQSLPPKPEAARVAPTPAQLIAPETQARPARSDELLLRSERRRDDRFDLPPS